MEMRGISFFGKLRCPNSEPSRHKEICVCFVQGFILTAWKTAGHIVGALIDRTDRMGLQQEWKVALEAGDALRHFNVLIVR